MEETELYNNWIEKKSIIPEKPVSLKEKQNLRQVQTLKSLR